MAIYRKRLLEAESEIGAKMLFPIHIEYPEIYKKITNEITLVKESEKYAL